MFHHPHIAVGGPSAEGYMASIGRRMRDGFAGRYRNPPTVIERD
jgi:hypothetical protein